MDHGVLTLTDLSLHTLSELPPRFDLDTDLMCNASMAYCRTCEISNTSSDEVCQTQRCHCANYFVMSSLLIDSVPGL